MSPREQLIFEEARYESLLRELEISKQRLFRLRHDINKPQENVAPFLEAGKDLDRS